jgi:hypothetical protein
MDLLDLLKLMFRRWYVTAPVVVLTLAAALGLGFSIQPEYQTSAAVLLVPPTTSTAAPAPNASPRPGNPWLRIGEAEMAQAVQISVSAHDSRTKIEAAGGVPNYEVGLVTRSSILTVDVTATTRARALATVTGVTNLIKEVVAGQQAQYKPGAGEQITTEVLDPGLNISQSRSNVLRAQIVVGVIGLLLAAVASVGYDAVDRRRAAARQTNRRRARLPLAWNDGVAAVGARRPVPPATASPDQDRPSRSAAVRPRSAEGGVLMEDVPLAGSAPGPRGTAPATASNGTPTSESPAGDRAAQSDDTLLLGAARAPADDPAK